MFNIICILRLNICMYIYIYTSVCVCVRVCVCVCACLCGKLANIYIYIYTHVFNIRIPELNWFNEKSTGTPYIYWITGEIKTMDSCRCSMTFP